MAIFFGWIIFSFLAGFVGSDRKCGFGKAFLLSLIFSPLVGLIYAFSSTKNSTIEFQNKMVANRATSTAPVQPTYNQDDPRHYIQSVENDIESLNSLYFKNVITEAELNEKTEKLKSDPKYISAKQFVQSDLKPTVTQYNKPL